MDPREAILDIVHNSYSYTYYDVEGHMFSRSFAFTACMSVVTLLTTHIIDAQAPEIKTVAEYTTRFESDTPMFTLYSATWCGPCKQLKPHFHKIAQNSPNIFCCVIDTDNEKLSSIVDPLDIRSVPTLIFSCNGSVISRKTGMSKDNIEQWVKECLASHKKSVQKRSSSKKSISVERQSIRTNGNKKTRTY